MLVRRNAWRRISVVVSDIKNSTITAGIPQDFEPDTLAWNNYYAFGMLQPGRNSSSPSYRYGFNGMEKDDEVKGSGNSYTTYFRQLDSRLGRWFKVDPQAVRGPGLSPYSYAFNDPVDYVDTDGEWPSKWSRFWDWLNNGDYGGEFYENPAAKDGDENKYGVKIGDQIYYNKDDLTLATLDDWDIEILATGLDNFAPKHPQDKESWDKKDLRDKLDLAKAKQIRKIVSEVSEEQFAPIKELYQMGAGPSGLGTGLRLIPATMSKRAFWSGPGTAEKAAEMGIQ